MSQIGTDRIIEFQFSEGQYRLYLEFYAGGNIILTDSNLDIIALLRNVNEDQEKLNVGSRYTLDNRQNYKGVPELTPERARSGLEKVLENNGAQDAGGGKRSKKKPGDALRRALAASLNEFPPLLLEHSLRTGKFDTKTPIEDVLNDQNVLERLTESLQEATKILNGVNGTKICKGYIIAKKSNKAPDSDKQEVEESIEPPQKNLLYEDFHPFRPQQFEDNSEISILEYDGFNKTVDEFYSSIESQKLESRLTEREEHAKRKLENARLDHDKRLGGLQQIQELNVRKAQAIEANLQRVQEAIAAVNGLLAQGMDWMDVARLVEMEQAKHNMVAEMIQLPLKLYENTATLLLSEATFDDEDEDDYDGDETGSDVSDSGVEDVKASKVIDKRLAVDVDLALSPWSNARQYYDQKKIAAVKEQKTLQSSEKALKSTKRKISADLKKGLKQEKELLRPQRKALWFEKFIYFISSEGYLVLAGKDLPQNEILYKKYLKKGDIYVHADLEGAASIVVKNKPGMTESPIPPSTLSQAGTLAAATSIAWDSKAVMSAWWVDAEQVSKIASTGEYMATGCFHISSNKNFLPPAQLILGFGVFFRISDESKLRHHKHRTEGGRPVVMDIGPEVPLRKSEADHEESDHVPADEPETIHTPDEDKSEDDHSEGIRGHDTISETSNVDEADDDKDDDLQDSGSEVAQENPLQRASNQENEPEVREKDTQRTTADTASSKSSDVDPEHGEEDEVQISGETAAHDNRIRHLSARERRPARQGLAVSSETSPGADQGGASEEITRASTSATTEKINLPKRPTNKPQPAHVRGKHGKRNKLKAKYAEQDEEDRALAMGLLGSAAAQQKASEETVAKAAKERELAEQKERRRKQHVLALEKGREAEEMRRMQFEANAETLDDRETEELEDINAFVGSPLAGDDILDALVVCGPWDAIGSRCRWRVKLQPGTTKKGKAVREILHIWTGAITEREKKRRSGAGEGNATMMEEEVTRKREGELIRAIRETEVVGVVPVGKLRVVAGAQMTGGRGKGGGKGKRGGKGSKK